MGAFVAVEELEDYLQTKLQNLAAAELAVAGASDAIRTYVGQRLDFAEDDQVVIEGSGTDVLVLPELPVVDVSLVEVHDTSEFVELEEEEDWRLGESGLLIRLGPRIWASRVRVTYSHGYEQIPADLKSVALQVAARLYERQGGVSAVSLDNYSVSYDGEKGFSKVEKAVLDRHRIR